MAVTALQPIGKLKLGSVAAPSCGFALFPVPERFGWHRSRTGEVCISSRIPHPNTCIEREWVRRLLSENSTELLLSLVDNTLSRCTPVHLGIRLSCLDHSLYVALQTQ